MSTANGRRRLTTGFLTLILMAQRAPEKSMSLTLANAVVARATLSQAYAFDLLWRAEAHCPAGAQIELRSRTLRAFHNWRFLDATVEGATMLRRWPPHATVTERWHNTTHWLFRARLPRDLARGQSLRLRTHFIPPLWAGLTNFLSLWIADPSADVAAADAWRKESDSVCALPVAAGPVERLSLYVSPQPTPQGSFRACLAPQDRFGNPACFLRPTAVTLRWMGTTWSLPVTATTPLALPVPSATARLTASVPMAALAAEENIANGARAGDALVVESAPIWPDAPSGMRAAFGELHWHTELSPDGQGTLDEALTHARDERLLDFAVPGDHNPAGELWRATADALDRFYRPGQFVTLFGWENATPHGHENYYFTERNHPLACGGAAGITGGRPDALRDRLSALRDFVAIPHHPNAEAEVRHQESGRPLWSVYPWSSPVDYLRLVELMQVRGNHERDQGSDTWRIWHQGHGASAQDALARGHRIGFVGGTDNHQARPGRAFGAAEGAGRHPVHSEIITGAWIRSLDRKAVFEALRSRHTWAVWDTRALVWFEINGALMGEVLLATPGTPLTARIRLSAQDALQTIEIVSESRCVWQAGSAAPDVDWHVPLGPAERDTHFYLRALQRDGGLIYASPVFIECRPPADTSS